MLPCSGPPSEIYSTTNFQNRGEGRVEGTVPHSAQEAHRNQRKPCYDLRPRVTMCLQMIKERRCSFLGISPFWFPHLRWIWYSSPNTVTTTLSNDRCEHGSNHPCGNARPRSTARRDARFRQFLLAVAVDHRHCFSMHGADGLGAGIAYVHKGGGHQDSWLDRLYVWLSSPHDAFNEWSNYLQITPFLAL